MTKRARRIHPARMSLWQFGLRKRGMTFETSDASSVIGWLGISACRKILVSVWNMTPCHTIIDQVRSRRFGGLGG